MYMVVNLSTQREAAGLGVGRAWVGWERKNRSGGVVIMVDTLTAAIRIETEFTNSNQALRFEI